LVKLDSTKVKVFNPVVSNWDNKAQQNEGLHKAGSDLCLYCFTPEMVGYYSAFELGLDLGKRPEQTVFCLLTERKNQSFTSKQLEVLIKIQKDVIAAGGHVFNDLEKVAVFLNTYE
jgi:hypothetical protein